MASLRALRQRAAVTGGCLGILLLVSGCTGTPASSTGPTSQPAPSATAETPPEPAEVATECVDGDWSADLNGLIGQLADQLSASGLTVSRADATGTQTLSIAREGVLGFDADMTFVVSVDMGGGMTMSMTQVHTGTLEADWSWAGDVTDQGGTVQFSNFRNSGYDVQTSFDINGQAAEAPFALPSLAAADVPTVVTCDGDTLTTQPQGTPFTTTWSRSG